MDVDATHEYAFEHPSPGRYLLTPSARPLGAGAFSASQKEIAFTQLSVGATDTWTVELGGSIPSIFGRGTGAVLTVRGARPARGDLYVGGSLNVYGGWWDFGEGVYGVAPTVDVTWGGRDGHLTARVTQPWFSSAAEPLLPAALIVAGERRTGNHTAFVAEWWFLVDLVGEPAYGDEQRTLLVPGGAFRLLGRYLTLDLGLVPIVDDNVLMPFPWIDLSGYWGFAP